jgi:hypothetical protein
VLQTRDESVCSGRLSLVHEKPIDESMHPLTEASAPQVLEVNAPVTQQ